MPNGREKERGDGAQMGASLSLQEIQDALTDQGYSADGRKGWLREVLTELEAVHAREASAEMADLIDSIKTVLACSPASGHCCELDFGSNIGAENAEEALFP
ncbi:hypothetical protein [Amorphus sp. MBR-141]